MDLSDASKRVGAQIDGFIGQDILAEFSAVRIDYKAHVLELSGDSTCDDLRAIATCQK
jgi:hypothetical protein